MKKVNLGEKETFTRNLQSKLTQSSPTKLFKFNKNNVVRRQQRNLTDLYEIKEKIGAGSFGEVFKVEHKQLKLIRALKTIKKTQKSQIHNPVEELEILKELDHPNVLKIYQYFENEHEWQIITQFFDGKELFEEILAEKKISEQKAVLIFEEISKALSYIHKNKIVHRDLKPENIMIKKLSNGQYQVKVIDWGLGSKFVTELIRKCGTPEYCAPEVIKGSYGSECDVWSLGVLLYVMLSGKFPFRGNNAKQTLVLILKSNFKFNDLEWAHISNNAKMLISKLLQKDPKMRPSAAQCLQQEWVKKTKVCSESPSEVNLIDTLNRLKHVSFENKFQSVVVSIVKNFIQSTEKEAELKKQFETIDQNKDGILSFEEIKKAYQKVYPSQEAHAIAENLFLEIDLDKSKSIQYSQFVAFGSKIKVELSRVQLEEVFRMFDENQDGKIDKKELSSFVGYERLVQSADFEQLLRQIDKNNDGAIDIDEFIESIHDSVNKAVNEKKLQSQENIQDLCHELFSHMYEDSVRKITESSCSTLSILSEKSAKEAQQQNK